MNREAFLTRVKQAAQSGRAYRVHVTEHDARAGYCGAGPDPLGRFAEEMILVGGLPHLVATLDEARLKLVEIILQAAPASALCWRHPVLDQLRLGELLKEICVEQLDYENLSPLPQEQQRAQILACGIGISSCSWAIGETGSLAMFSGPGRERLASLAPPVHVAIITADQVLPDLFDLFDQLVATGPEKLPSNLTLITGPSKTGDLELRLVTGVHGPGQWHVIICRETSAK